MDTITLKFTGTAPLLMHAPRSVNPFDELTQEMKAITRKKVNKTLDDQLALSRLEWEAGLYFDPEMGPYIPGVNVEAMLRESATMTKFGKKVRRAVVVSELKLPLEYHGPRGTNGRGVQEMWDHNLKYLTSIKNGMSGRVMRCRPQFPVGWELAVPIMFEPEEIDQQTLLAIVERASRMIGLGDYRPRFGRFVFEVI